MSNLNGKVALITGAGGKNGIGCAIAKRLAQDGADVVVNDIVDNPHASDQSEWQGLSDVVREIEAIGSRAFSILADVSDAKQVSNAVDRVVSDFGKIDILVNNAGIQPGKDRMPVIDLAEEDWDKVQRVNVKGTFLCSQAVGKHLVSQGTGGKIINISSIFGKQGMPRYAAYSASKFAIIGLTQSLSFELAPYQVNVNAICPSLVDTERVSNLVTALNQDGQPSNEQYEEFINRRVASVPLGRLAKSTDVANMASFLASDEANFLTGISVTVAGGSMMH